MDVPLTPLVVDVVTFDRAPLGRRGYNEDQVDDFLDRVQATLAGEDTLTAHEVRAVEFDPAPFIKRGYHEDQVDEFLDLVVEELDRREGNPPGGGAPTQSGFPWSRPPNVPGQGTPPGGIPGYAAAPRTASSAPATNTPAGGNPGYPTAGSTGTPSAFPGTAPTAGDTSTPPAYSSTGTTSTYPSTAPTAGSTGTPPTYPGTTPSSTGTTSTYPGTSPTAGSTSTPSAFPGTAPTAGDTSTPPTYPGTTPSSTSATSAYPGTTPGNTDSSPAYSGTTSTPPTYPGNAASTSTPPAGAGSAPSAPGSGTHPDPIAWLPFPPAQPRTAPPLTPAEMTNPMLFAQPPSWPSPGTQPLRREAEAASGPPESSVAGTTDTTGASQEANPDESPIATHAPSVAAGQAASALRAEAVSEVTPEAGSLTTRTLADYAPKQAPAEPTPDDTGGEPAAPAFPFPPAPAGEPGYAPSDVARLVELLTTAPDREQLTDLTFGLTTTGGYHTGTVDAFRQAWIDALPTKQP